MQAMVICFYFEWCWDWFWLNVGFCKFVPYYFHITFIFWTNDETQEKNHTHTQCKLCAIIACWSSIWTSKTLFELFFLVVRWNKRKCTCVACVSLLLWGLEWWFPFKFFCGCLFEWLLVVFWTLVTTCMFQNMIEDPKKTQVFI